MEQGIDSRLAETPEGASQGQTSRVSLTARIFALNVLAVLLFAGSLFYIDSFRQRLVDERMAQARIEANLMALALAKDEEGERAAVLDQLVKQTDARIRFVRPNHTVQFDSWSDSPPKFRLIDPATENWQRSFARSLDDVIDFVVVANEPPSFAGFDISAVEGERLAIAPDRTHMITSTRKVQGSLLILDQNARDIRRLVRAERSKASLILAAVIILSALMSLFLARTIVEPLKMLAQAAANVRLGRAREVEVPRLPERGDEIGQLARALADMNAALQSRIDATEHFAADVAHEIKNPLASLSSAAETLGSVKDAKLREQLIGIIRHDVTRLDRLITDISDLSRIDGQLARADFERLDMVGLIDEIVQSTIIRNPGFAERIAFARPAKDTTMVRGDAARLGRALENVIDNAMSFSPEAGIIAISAARARNSVVVAIEDDGPGVPAGARKRIFERFHSDRPGEDSFGKHSGLGLSIVTAILEAHRGKIRVEGRGRGHSGARFVITLPFAK